MSEIYHLNLCEKFLGELQTASHTLGIPKSISLCKLPIILGRVPEDTAGATAVRLQPLSPYKNALISRSHAVIRSCNLEDGSIGVAVVDNNSTNGVYVNRVRLEAQSPRRLQVGDRICFGVVNSRKTSAGAKHDSDANEASVEYLLDARASVESSLSGQPNCRTAEARDTEQGGNDVCATSSGHKRQKLSHSQGPSRSAVEQSTVNAVQGSCPQPQSSVGNPQGSQEMDPSLECVICRGLLAVACSLMCGHVFCWVCCHGWRTAAAQKAEGSLCPTCRGSMNNSRRCLPLDNLAEKMASVVHKDDPAELEEWRERKRQGLELALKCQVEAAVDADVVEISSGSEEEGSDESEVVVVSSSEDEEEITSLSD